MSPIETQTATSPPNRNGTGITSAADFPDEIRELGDKIVALTILQAQELSDYLKHRKEHDEGQ